jgi:hypothetical protein
MANFGDTLARAVDARIAASPATQAALAAILPWLRYDGQLCVVEADQTEWQFVLASVASAAAGQVIDPSDSPANGRWLAVSSPGGTALALPQAGPNAVMALPLPYTGQLVVDTTTGFLWRFSATSTAVDVTQNLVLSPPAWATGTAYLVGAVETAGGNVYEATAILGTGTSAGSGGGPTGTTTYIDNPGGNQITWTWVRATGGAWIRDANSVDLKLAVSFATADATVLFTVPVGFKLRINRSLHEVTISWTGGTASAIGMDSSNTAYSTPGDILGGSAGDIAATLVSTGSPYKGGTLGTKFGSNGVVVLVAGDTIKWNRITSAYTAGTGFEHVEVEIIN